MPVTRRYTTFAAYLAALKADSLRWFMPQPGSYEDLHDANLLPRGF